MASVGGVYLNFGLWALSLVPAWLAVRKIGASKDGEDIEKEKTVSALASEVR